MRRIAFALLAILIAALPARADLTVNHLIGFGVGGGSCEGITLVGSAEGGAIDGGGFSINLPAMSQGDIVVYMLHGHANAGQTQPRVSTGDYTDASAFSGPTTAAFVGYKIMGASPDATIAFTSTGAANDATSAVVQVFRGVDQSTPMDATATVATANSATPDSPSITTVTNGAAVISAIGTFATDASITAPSGYGDQVDITQSDTFPSTTGMAWVLKAVAGAEDPASWTDFSASAQWRAHSVALRPAC